MSSEQKTSTLGLSKYQGDEHLLREDFNSDLEKIDTAISEMSNPVETTINDKTISFNTNSNLKKVTLKILSDVTGGPILVSRNGQTAKPLKLPNDEAVTELLAETMFYDVIENMTAFYLAPKGAKLEGNAIANDVLFGKTFCNKDQVGLTGTLDLSTLRAENIKAGVLINRIEGAYTGPQNIYEFSKSYNGNKGTYYTFTVNLPDDSRMPKLIHVYSAYMTVPGNDARWVDSNQFTSQYLGYFGAETSSGSTAYTRIQNVTQVSFEIRMKDSNGSGLTSGRYDIQVFY